MKAIRKFLVKNFVGYVRYQSTHPREIGIMFLVPSIVAVLVLTGPGSWWGLAAAAVTCLAICLLPFKRTSFQRLRASRVLYPGFYTTGLFIARTYPISWAWYHCVALLIIVLLIWFGFSGYRISYFDMFPVSMSELDQEQLADYNKDGARLNLKIIDDTKLDS